MSLESPAYDLILVGGGLANGLIAWRLSQLRPDLRLLLLEQGSTLGGNHTWSFHDPDLSVAQQLWLEPLVVHRWPGYEVRFPERQRQLESGYACLTSTRFDGCLRTQLGERVRTDCPVREVHPEAVLLKTGERLTARAVIDGRGPRPSPHLALGYQKFLGQEVRLEQPHGLDRPRLMDATVAQHEGYRFIYVLPLAPDRLLIEDTYYADGDSLSADTLRSHIAAYARAHGWSIAQVLREEQGVLPITLAGDPRAFCIDWQGVPRSGLAAGLFHATTGYSLPHAVRLAERIAALAPLNSYTLLKLTQSEMLAEWRRQGFFRLLNRMLFLAGRPQDRWQVMQRFYGLPEELIQRFYAGRLQASDKLRIVTGKPPVPLDEACRAALAGSLHLTRKHS